MSIYDNINELIPIDKGWSGDKKYCATTSDGSKYLLRITPDSNSANSQLLYEMIQLVMTLDIPMCKLIEFGKCDRGEYALYSWIDGEDAIEVVPNLSESEQYIMGYNAGQIAKKIHTIPAPPMQEDWATRFNRKTNLKIQRYNECGLKFKGDDKIIEYIVKNRYLLDNRPQSFQHGDYHIGNMMIRSGEIVIIDFDRYDFGDPWEEFNRIVWCAQTSPLCATGMIDGYFDNEPPILFWRLLAFYIASNTLSSIYWAIPFGQDQVDIMMNQSQDVLDWYDNMQNAVPTWYQYYER